MHWVKFIPFRNFVLFLGVLFDAAFTAYCQQAKIAPPDIFSDLLRKAQVTFDLSEVTSGQLIDPLFAYRVLATFRAIYREGGGFSQAFLGGALLLLGDYSLGAVTTE